MSATTAVSPIVAARCRCSGKVVNANFTPRTLRLAVAGKRAARCATTVEDAFPADKQGFMMEILKQIASQDSDGSLKEAFLHALTNMDVQRDLCCMVCVVLLTLFVTKTCS